LRTWRRRAWSPRAADAPFIELEKRIVAAQATAKPADTSVADWQAAAAALEYEHEHWRLPEIGDVLAELERD
jgi:hypothetical protein